jgi:hypothetical protein
VGEWSSVSVLLARLIIGPEEYVCIGASGQIKAFHQYQKHEQFVQNKKGQLHQTGRKMFTMCDTGL